MVAIFYRLKDIIGNRKEGIQAIIPVSKSSWWAGVKSLKYPQPFKLGEKTTVWRSTDIEELIAGVTK